MSNPLAAFVSVPRRAEREPIVSSIKSGDTLHAVAGQLKGKEKTQTVKTLRRCPDHGELSAETEENGWFVHLDTMTSQMMTGVVFGSWCASPYGHIGVRECIFCGVKLPGDWESGLPNAREPKAKGGERSKTNPRQLTLLKLIRCAQNLENKPTGTISHSINHLQRFLACF